MTTSYIEKRQIDWKKKRRAYLFGSLFCCASAIFLFGKRNDLVPLERLVNLGSLTFKEKPSIEKEPGKYGGKYLKLVFIEISNPLRISGVDYGCADIQQLLVDFNQGDTMQVLVDKNDFDGFLKYKGEKVYGLMADNKNYCNLDCRNKNFTFNQNIGSIAFGTLTIFCLISGLMPSIPRLKISKYKTYDIEPLSIIIPLTVIIIYIARSFI